MLSESKDPYTARTTLSSQGVLTITLGTKFPSLWKPRASARGIRHQIYLGFSPCAPYWFTTPSAHACVPSYTNACAEHLPTCVPTPIPPLTLLGHTKL